MSGQRDIMLALRDGPRTASELADLTCDSPGSVSRTASKLIVSCRVIRIDGKTGRGTRALYALPATPSARDQTEGE